jgi:hypothetical protein
MVPVTGVALGWCAEPSATRPLIRGGWSAATPALCLMSRSRAAGAPSEALGRRDGGSIGAGAPARVGPRRRLLQPMRSVAGWAKPGLSRTGLLSANWSGVRATFRHVVLPMMWANGRYIGLPNYGPSSKEAPLRLVADAHARGVGRFRFGVTIVGLRGRSAVCPFRPAKAGCYDGTRPGTDRSSRVF